MSARVNSKSKAQLQAAQSQATFFDAVPRDQLLPYRETRTVNGHKFEIEIKIEGPYSASVPPDPQTGKQRAGEMFLSLHVDHSRHWVGMSSPNDLDTPLDALIHRAYEWIEGASTQFGPNGTYYSDGTNMEDEDEE